MTDDKHWLAPPKWWKKVKPLRWLAISGIVFVAFSAVYTAKVLIAPAVHAETARFTAVVGDPVAFLDGLNSYDTVAAATARLDAAKAVSVAVSQRPVASSKYPPRDRDTLTVSAYQHLGEAGTLKLEFFNDRLYAATFVPQDPVSYADRLHAADLRLKKDASNRIDFVDGPLRIASNVDFAATVVGLSLNTKPYVIWQDTRLVDALDEWDRRFVVSFQKK